MSLRSRRFPCAARQVAVVLTIASIVIVIAVPSQAQADPEEILADIEKRSNRQTYCGAHLVDALHVACGGSYNGMFTKQKKKNLGLPEDELMRQQENDPNFLLRQSQDNTYDILQGLQGLQGEPGNSAWIPRPDRFPFRERLNARAFLSGALRRNIRGVHDECCAKSCSLNELRLYCSS